MIEMSTADVARAVGAELPFAVAGVVGAIRIDSREVGPTDLFVAIRGERMDGHDFVLQAVRRGAAAVIADRAVQAGEAPVLLVPDTVRALGDLGRWVRASLTGPLVGVTGSVGKTSTRGMIAAGLEALGPVLCPERNLNTEIGVPLTLFRLDGTQRSAVIEMGMRGSGQIGELARIAQPTIGLITNIGITHMELLGSRDAIADAKAELLDGIPSAGLAILPADDPYLARLRAHCACRIETFGVASSADWRVDDVVSDDTGLRCTVSGLPVRIAASGRHHAVNAAAAFAACAAAGVPPSEIAARLWGWTTGRGRGAALRGRGGATVIDDTYNAAPDSMAAALAALIGRCRSTGERAIAVLGCMRELGPESEAAHIALGRSAAAGELDLLITVGELAGLIADGARDTWPTVRIERAADRDEAITIVEREIRSGDAVLVKASRSMELEVIVDSLLPVDG